MFPIAVFSIFIFIALIKHSDKKQNEKLSYRKHSFLCSKAEYSFYRVLVKAVDPDYVVCPKVRVSDVLRPESWMKGKKWWDVFNRISRKHFDYVICSSGSLSIVAAVELDDISHESSKAIKADAFKDFVTQNADLPLLRFRSEKSYKISEIRCSLPESIVLFSNPLRETEVS